MVDFSAEEVFWLAKLGLNADLVITYVLDNSVFNGDKIKTFSSKKIAQLKVFRCTGTKSDWAGVLWGSSSVNEQRGNFMNKLIESDILNFKIVVPGKTFYEFDKKECFKVFKESEKGKFLFDFFDNNCTIIIE